MRKPRVHEVKLTRKRGSWKAKPAVVRAKAGDSIHWKGTGSDMTLFFPKKKLFWHHDFEIARGQGLVLKVGAGKKGKYPSAAFCHSANCFAEGKSNPIVIID